MFSDVTLESTSRLIEVRTHLDFIKSKTPKPPKTEPTNILIAKGLFFVHLYGAYEFTVKSTVSRAIDLINKKSPLVNDCKHLFLSIVLNSELDSIASVGDKKWERRHNLFSEFEASRVVQIHNDIFPTNGRNIRYRQLESIWKSFSISDPILPRSALGGRITELVENRNAIAHGNQPAAVIGSLNTIAELYQRHSDISEVCSYVIQIFDDYIEKEKFLKGN
jgi:hypothetical protein